MILSIYAIKDTLAECWSNLFVLNSKTAERTFRFMAKEKSEAECKDQKIFLLGKFDNEAGTISLLEEPYMVFDLDKEWNKAHGN